MKYAHFFANWKQPNWSLFLDDAMKEKNGSNPQRLSYPGIVLVQGKQHGKDLIKSVQHAHKKLVRRNLIFPNVSGKF